MSSVTTYSSTRKSKTTMGVENVVPKELKESINELLGRPAVLQSMVQLEGKGDRLDPRALVLTDYRLYIFHTRLPAKAEQAMAYLDIVSLESPAPHKLIIATENKKLTVVADQVDGILLQLADSLHAAFPCLSLQDLVPSLQILDTPRMLRILDAVRERSASREPGPCGGFSAAYRALCDYHSMACQEEVAWDVDTIYLSQDTHELSLPDWDHLDSKHLVPIIAALERNTWFTRLNAASVKLNADALNEIIKVLKRNTCLEEVCVSNSGIRGEFVQRLSGAVTANEGSQLRALDLSDNHLEDKVLPSLTSVIQRLPHGLTALHLRRVGLSARGLSRLADALAAHTHTAATLQTLDVSGNQLRPSHAEDLASFHQFLSKPNALTHLNLSGTECALDNLFGALQMGCTQHLKTLDLSGNVFSLIKKYRAEPSVPLAWKQFFSVVLTLEKVSFESCRGLPAEAIKSILLGLSTNLTLPPSGVSLNLSGCGLGSSGAMPILEACLMSLRNINALDLSDNQLDMDLPRLMVKMIHNTCVRRLNIGRNFAGVKPKYLPAVLESIVQLIQDEMSPIECLSVADSKLRTDTTILINALGANSSLTEIDISGNLMGEMGARMLAKALQLNTKLETVYWDHNGTTAGGFVDIAAALDKNFTLKKMPVPVNDAIAAMKGAPDKTQSALTRIESLLARNHSRRRVAREQAYRLTQGFLLSSTQQMVDKLSTDLSKLLDVAPAADSAGPRKMLAEADNARQLLPTFQRMALSGEDEVEQQLKAMARQLQELIEAQVKHNVSAMMRHAEEQCPTVMNEKGFQSEMRAACEEKASVRAQFSEELLLQQVSTDVNNKISEVNLAVAAHMSDRLVDGVLESLDRTYKNLSGRRGESALDREARRSLLRKSSESLGDSPKVSKKKKSLYSRRLRPQSTINAKEVHEAAQKLRLAGTKEETGEASPPPPTGATGSPRPVRRPPPPPQAQTPPSHHKHSGATRSPAFPTATTCSSPSSTRAATVRTAASAGTKTNNTQPTPTEQPTPVSHQPTSTTQPIKTAPTHPPSPLTTVKSSKTTSASTPSTSTSTPTPTPTAVPAPSAASPVPAPRRKRHSDVSRDSCYSLASIMSTSSTDELDEEDRRSTSKPEEATGAVGGQKSDDDELALTVPIVDSEEDDDYVDAHEYDLEEEEEGGGGSMDTTELELTDASTVDSLLEDSRESTPSTDSRPAAPSTPSDFDDLSSSAPKLQHLAKNRPRRAKTHAASRAVIKSEAETVEDIGGMDVDEFFDNRLQRETSHTDQKNGMGPAPAENATESVKVESKRPKTMKVPFGPDRKNIKAGISNFFRKASPSPKSPEPPRTEPSPDPSDTDRRSSRDLDRQEPERKAEEEKSEAPVEERRPAGGVPVGGVPMGGAPPGGRPMLGKMPMGGGFLSELKTRQRTSVLPPSQPPPAKATTPVEEEEKKEEEPPVAPARVPRSYGTNRPPSLFPKGQRDAADPPPRPAPRQPSPPSAEKLEENKPKPPPPLKPRPMVRPKPKSSLGTPAPVTKPLPPQPKQSGTLPATATTPGSATKQTTSKTPQRSSVRAYLRRFQDPDDEAGERPERKEGSPSSAIKKRGSVRERARFLDKNSNVDQPPLRTSTIATDRNNESHV